MPSEARSGISHRLRLCLSLSRPFSLLRPVSQLARAGGQAGSRPSPSCWLRSSRLWLSFVQNFWCCPSSYLFHVFVLQKWVTDGLLCISDQSSTDGRSFLIEVDCEEGPARCQMRLTWGFSTEGDSSPAPSPQPHPQGTYSKTWRWFWFISWLRRDCCYWRLVGRGQGCSKHPTIQNVLSDSEYP